MSESKDDISVKSLILWNMDVVKVISCLLREEKYVLHLNYIYIRTQELINCNQIVVGSALKESWTRLTATSLRQLLHGKI